MRADPANLLAALHLADSAFPAGGFAFSWGLEGLAADGLVSDAAGVAETIRHQLAHRWQGMDRPLLARAHAATDAEAVRRVDLLAEACCLSAPLRAGARRAGRALLAACARFGWPSVLAYRALLPADARLGHLPVMQGLAFRAAGLPGDMAEALGGWSVIAGLASAAIRLGLIGHAEALRMTADLRGDLAELLDRPAPDAPIPASFTPLADIAMMRGGLRDLRLFAT